MFLVIRLDRLPAAGAGAGSCDRGVPVGELALEGVAYETGCVPDGECCGYRLDYDVPELRHRSHRIAAIEDCENPLVFDGGQRDVTH
ncbi:hypothetical protein [Rhodococcus globerulus]|uniref:hypothetical protein n=1 Tax=Rhodococcus globerulus TaxID=33008 RepID=UPI001F161FED|nr:hypothetical protein [Rhodococcus globerulus]